MDEDIKQIDIKIVIQALGCFKIDDVWEQYCEKERLFSDRIYWRSVFFEAIKQRGLPRTTWLYLPRGKEFYSMVVEFAKEIK